MIAQILLVEDDVNLGYILKEYLQMHDFGVFWAKDGDEGFQAFQSNHFDLCILDVMMPKKDGFELASEIKASSHEVPLIFLTAKSLKVDKLKGFKIGCDDYIIKPVDEEELIARLHAVLKRSQRTSESGTEFCAIGNYTFNPKNQQLYTDKIKHTLTTKEAKILTILSQRKGTLIERDRILKELWGESDYFNRRSMDVFITKLRKYLQDDPKVSITNVHGKGFILEENE